MSNSEKSPKNKCVVITGGASGIGYEIADNFLRKGARQVALLDLIPKVGDDAVKNLTAKYGAGKAVFFKCDVANETDSKQVFKKLLDACTRVDVLVNNAGVLDEQNWKKCLDINLTYLVGWSIKFWDYMRKDSSGQGGTIINIASIYGYRVDQYIPVYQATKFGVFGFSKSLGHQYNYSRTGVRVLTLCPGFTKTPMAEDPTDQLDEQMTEGFKKMMDTEAVWQTMDCVGMAAVEIFEKSDSGKAWLIEGGKPVVEI